MQRYVLLPAAVRMRDKIYEDTFKVWGEAQADKYILEMGDYLTMLADTPALWRQLPSKQVLPEGAKGDAFIARYARHMVFFRKQQDGRIGVISIRHVQMDLPAHFAKDLQRILDSDD